MRYTYLPLLHRCHAIYTPVCGTHIYHYSTDFTQFIFQYAVHIFTTTPQISRNLYSSRRYTYLPLLHRCHAIYILVCGTHIYQYATNVTQFIFQYAVHIFTTSPQMSCNLMFQYAVHIFTTTPQMSYHSMFKYAVSKVTTTPQNFSS
jgi:hypothetical protein